MAVSATFKEYVRIIFLCICWYAVSSANNVVGKVILNDFPYPMTVTVVQLLSITAYTAPFLTLYNIPAASNIPVKYWATMIIPLALGKFFSSVSSHISIWKVPVSYAHTVKATLPFFTVVLSRIFLHEKQTPTVYLSLIPIIVGVVIASMTELSFDMIGLISALAATFGFSLQNIFSKKCLKETGIHHIRLLFILAQYSCMMTFPLWLYWDLPLILADTSLWHSSHAPRLVALLFIDGFCNFAQNMIAFTVISLLTPLSYAVANATKRIAIISFSLLTFKNPVSTINICGMLFAVVGVLLYNKAKHDQRKEKAILPHTKEDLAKNGSNGHMAPSVLLQQNGFSNRSFQNHFVVSAASMQPASVTRFV